MRKIDKEAERTKLNSAIETAREIEKDMNAKIQRNRDGDATDLFSKKIAAQIEIENITGKVIGNFLSDEDFYEAAEEWSEYNLSTE